MSAQESVARGDAEMKATAELLHLDSVDVRYQAHSDESLTALTDVTLTIEPGEFVTIIGPSGCGKSTLLHCMGGMLRPSQGEVLFRREKIVRPDARKAAFVFQDYSLFPWKSVLDNVAMGLRFAGVSKRDARARATEQLDFVGLGDFAGSYPRALSGGMQQRVAVARALAMQPDVLLMDEPFGALDEQTRRTLGYELAQILARSGQSVVLITHSLEEAVFWADRILVMSARPGRIVEEITVEQPRPRDLEFAASAEFQRIRAHLLDRIALREQPAAPVARDDDRG